MKEGFIMKLNTLHLFVKLAAIVMWLATIISIVIAIQHHQFWQLMPIIAHNRVQNYLGWLVTGAVLLSIYSFSLKYTIKKK